MGNSKIRHHYPIHIQDIINLMMVSSWRKEHTPSSGCNENMIALNPSHIHAISIKIS